MNYPLKNSNSLKNTYANSRLFAFFTDINFPDFGDRVLINPDEKPMFWACGITSQVALEEAKPPFCITHSPGYMLVTDILNSSLRVST